ncbi:Protein of unknown function [Salinimicrobium catena]|uniref:DUF4197 domain-containing protein n=1 Tax=Salinimicrobium catena TaxID=390640 RepID=A0A1H5NDY2_9FLAO|nr:DUF4197 domain-containing protein [Salinimicrobium catena]SDL44014.1 Protein of unknown function [Salinimicrobium catena]SEE99803.1 Protein of unknown function [Salinimicrobium catena]
MKKYLLVFIVPLFLGCAELQQIADNLPTEGGYVSNAEVAAGLRQALNFGIEKQVSKLTEEDGFFRNELVRITLPPELQKVDRTLRDVGLDALADEGLKVLNRAAEDAVKEATPIFVNAVKEITFTDARNILTGSDKAATTYLENKTTAQLYSKFNPVISNSLDEVGATQVWANIIDRYNALPLTSSVNPDLPDYVTNEALEGVFTMIAIEEKEIRNNFSARTTELLKRVFALQDQ